MRRSFLFLAVPFALSTVACAADREMEGDEGQSAAQEQAEKWSTADDPAIFGPDSVRTLADLPNEGEAAQIPWAGNYWPVWKDSINDKWAGADSDSPAKKYEKAFGGQNVEDAVSKHHGIESRTSAKVCKADAECDSALGEKCGKRPGKEEGRCIPTWFGICHAWAPASILVAEPKREVTKNGVTFKVQDIKALATLVHNKTTTKFVSLRCDKNGDKGDISFDNHGRPNAGECKDTNAGTFHLLLTNYLGIMKQSFVEDRTFDYEVWNQPLRGYKVVEKREVSVSDALKLVGVSAVGGTTVKKSGEPKKDEWNHLGSFDVTPGSNYKVLMTGTGDADLYVNFGSEPTTSTYSCRPYASGSGEECTGTVPEGATKMFVSVQGYDEASKFDLSINTGGTLPTTWVFNPDAKSFVYFKTDVRYISESAASTDGNLSSRIDQYTKSDRYEYVLELDAAGKVIGGEWVGASKKAHPDFVWLPVAASGATVAGGTIAFAKVKEILDEATANDQTAPPGAVEKTITESGTLAKGATKSFGPYNVAAGTKLSAVTTGNGDVDLYVRKASAPTTGTYDCRPYKSGSNESCSVDGGNAVYVMVRGFATSSTYSLTVKYVPTN